ncbi:MAG TPA: serine hydrolase domain-containing protein, partial [Solirubrobacteraceae bacterium]|nr:serine hydrolase domain-containing protein [Solirubrobacteraceae bacterium]
MGPLARYLAELARLGGVVSAAEALVAESGRVLWRGAAGFRVGGEALAAAAGARFDAASLTKPWMATLAVVLDRRGDLPLAAELGEIASGVAPALAGRTLEGLLRHRSGLPAWTPLAVRVGRRFREREALLDLLLGGTLLPGTSPGAAGADALYSDLGYILWGLLAELRTGRDLADLLDEEVCVPLGLARLGALAAEPPLPVECRLDNGREVELAAEQGIRLARQQPFLRGRPQDGNARALGFLTAHAGLFVTADEMVALAGEWLAPGRLLGTVEVARALAGDGGWALGW